MVDFQEYYNARKEITDIIKKDLLGPVTEDEVLTELPVNYYIAGKLYPRETVTSENSENIETSAVQYTVSELTNSSYDSDKSKSNKDYCEDLTDEISLCNTSMPSAMGISFTLNKDINEFNIEINCAKYKKEEIPNPEDDKNSQIQWSRIPFKYNKNFSVENYNRKPTPGLPDDLELRIILHKVYEDGTKTITVSLSNNNIVLCKSTGENKKEVLEERCIKTYFQPEIKISAIYPNTFCEAKKNIHLADTEESKEADLLYSDCINYAQGHGCAVSWETDSGGIKYIKTEFLPEFELYQMKPSSKFKDKILSMKFISETAKKEDIVAGINKLCKEYTDWIKKRKDEIINYREGLRETAERNLEKCRLSCERIMASAQLIDEDETVERAFRLANKAMFEQYKAQCKCKGEEPREDREWYPFQLAFILQELVAIADPKSEDRRLVDLLWFPTGGGKTEAYLGISAFTIFLRRLRLSADIKEDGVTIFMRYTLRLLTYQQFERAASLICACEVIRRNDNVPGGKISIGMWVGRALTPNDIKGAAIKLGKISPDERDKEKYYDVGDPRQIKKCPWCGTEISAEQYDIVDDKFIIKCPNEKCDFHGDDGIPALLIDEQIYNEPPTFVVATVDKFAQLALNDEGGALFGNCKNGKIFNPPDLIIQDELHLISGPLGTITGLYECAIKKLTTTKDGYSPKIIASTATIKNAAEQINALYASQYSQFPAQALNIKDSFFAEISTKKERPARKYLGCMAVGTSPTTMMIRVMAALLFSSRYIAAKGKYSDDVIDSFWTITDYFNSLRELGGAIVRVQDDIRYRFEYLRDTKFKNKYSIKYSGIYAELTSRIKSEDISNELHKLDNKYISNVEDLYDNEDDEDEYIEPHDFLLASNMISVGVDVGRLNSMVVVGQPMLTAEYIQATSRVGRITPGLVIATYNQAKSRDRSHFEQFTQFHNAFYKFVEATSITPFSDRARDRALQTVYVMLCRYLIDDLRDNESAGEYHKYRDNNEDNLEEIKKYILNYAQKIYYKEIDKDELQNVENELDIIDESWYTKSYDLRNNDKKLVYYSYSKWHRPPTLFEQDTNENDRFRVLNSMRSVETTVNAILDKVNIRYEKGKNYEEDR